MVADLLFYMFAGILLLSAGMVVTARNPIYCVLGLILTFFNAAGLFLLLGAEFLGLLLVMVYVGAIAVMFLFVLMTINIDFVELKEGFAPYLPVGLVVAMVLCIEFIAAAVGGVFSSGSRGVASQPAEEGVENIVQLGNVLFTNYIYPFLSVSIILLIAMVGAIVLTHRRRNDVRRQDIAKQVSRKREEAVELVKPGIGKGVKI